MKPTIVLVLCILVMPAFTQKIMAQQKLRFDKEEFYNTMSGEDINAIDNELILVKDAPKNKVGYEGALLMKKAGLISGPKKKLDLFKAGRIEMETAIINEPENTEYHFLRLAIEEHAPKIVKYHADILNDKAIVIRKFKDLSPVVQHAILDYCKKSKVLHAEDFS
ncbi:hypothetical protein [Mucilaginibacter sp.]